MLERVSSVSNKMLSILEESRHLRTIIEERIARRDAELSSIDAESDEYYDETEEASNVSDTEPEDASDVSDTEPTDIHNNIVYYEKIMDIWRWFCSRRR